MELKLENGITVQPYDSYATNLINYNMESNFELKNRYTDKIKELEDRICKLEALHNIDTELL